MKTKDNSCYVERIVLLKESKILAGYRSEK